MDKTIQLLLEQLDNTLNAIQRDCGECDKVFIHSGKAIFCLKQLDKYLKNKSEDDSDV